MVRPHLTSTEPNPMTLFVGLISLGLIVYLFTAMIWPEKF